MSLFRPGLDRGELRHIRATNTISARVVQQLKLMNGTTNFALVSMSDTGSGGVDVDGKVDTNVDKTKHDSMRKIFTDFYYDAEIGNDKLSCVPEISIDKLIQYQTRLSRHTAVSEEDSALKSIVNQYTQIMALNHLANIIIQKTLVSKIHLGYWRDVKSSAMSKLVYGVQSSPWKGFVLCSKVFRRTFELSNTQWNISKMYRLIVDSFWDVLDKSTAGFPGNFIIRNSRLRFLKVPLGAIDEEIRGKIDAINTYLDGNYHDLGLILSNITAESDVVAQTLKTGQTSITEQLATIKALGSDFSVISSNAPPGLVARYWPVLLLLVKYGPSSAINVWSNRLEIVDWVKLNFVDTVVGFWNNWVVKPIGDMLNILRDDNTMTITSKESLKSDLESLERMVQEFVKDNDVSVTPEEVHRAVSRGDLTMMMSQYEDEIRTPYRSILRGLLIRAMLIQVQKTKVDGGLAINGIDKLLKLQQLLFGVLSISPSLVILYQVKKALENKSSLQADLDSKKINCLRSMNQIEKLVNREETDDKLVGDGKLFIEIVNLTVLATTIVPATLRSEFYNDLNELAVASSGDGDNTSSNKVNRIWNMYSPYFRN